MAIKFARIFIRTLRTLAACYGQSKHVAILDSGALVQVSVLVQKGDYLVRSETSGDVVVRPCTSKLTQNQAEALSAWKHRQRKKAWDGVNWNSIPILSCKFVACAPSIYAGIYNQACGAKGEETSKESQIIVAIH